MTVVTSELESARLKFRDDLIDAGLLVPMGIDGLYGRSGEFENVIEGIDGLVRRTAERRHGSRPKVLRFPPVYPRDAFERTDYIASFPNLTGSVSTFVGDDRGHKELLADRDAGRPWDGHLDPAGTMLVAAACHPVYATAPSVVPDSGCLYDIYGYCFRHEPSVDPARMQAFRMHEYVFIGSPEQAQDHRDSWIDPAVGILEQLGLTAVVASANDPFFGRAGRMLAANQRQDDLKFELLVQIYGDMDEGTAVVSANCHRDHFGHSFELATGDGAPAHSACVGFGMERIALAMFSRHGLDPDAWPDDVRSAIG
jgi:seryl-tRNA synthetase